MLKAYYLYQQKVSHIGQKTYAIPSASSGVLAIKSNLTKVTLKTSVSQPSKAIQLTTKNKAAYATQTVSFKATLEKESSTKAKDLEWTVSELSDNNKNLWYYFRK